MTEGCARGQPRLEHQTSGVDHDGAMVDAMVCVAGRLTNALTRSVDSGGAASSSHGDGGCRGGGRGQPRLKHQTSEDHDGGHGSCLPSRGVDDATSQPDGAERLSPPLSLASPSLSLDHSLSLFLSLFPSFSPTAPLWNLAGADESSTEFSRPLYQDDVRHLPGRTRCIAHDSSVWPLLPQPVHAHRGSAWPQALPDLPRTLP